jgi:hypothetical protein
MVQPTLSPVTSVAVFKLPARTMPEAYINLCIIVGHVLLLEIKVCHAIVSEPAHSRHLRPHACGSFAPMCCKGPR